MNSKQLAWLIRRDGVEMTHVSGGSHIGAILSVADIVAVLYNDVANVSPDRLDDPDRDRVILSKGHAGAAIYSALASKGFFDRAELMTHYANGSRLSGHVSHKGIPGVEVSTGSLGHGVCMAAGMALAAKLDGKRYQTFAIVGDGECDEGSVWESAAFAGHQRLGNLTVVVDANGMQLDGPTSQVMDNGPIQRKFAAFGFECEEVDGHDVASLARVLDVRSERPRCVVARTMKGKGLSFAEMCVEWHDKALDQAHYELALAELAAQEGAIG